MENPYHHPEGKPHVVKSDEVRFLAFEVFNIVRASVSMQGSGDGEGEPTWAEQLHYELAEVELSKKLLRIAILMRTLDDFWYGWGHEDYVEKIASLNKDGAIGSLTRVGKEAENLTFRESFNKIIHATDIRPVYDTEDDREEPNARWGMNGDLELTGTTHRKEEWEATIHLFPLIDRVVEVLDLVDELQV
jgi:hypothetical protein